MEDVEKYVGRSQPLLERWVAQQPQAAPRFPSTTPEASWLRKAAAALKLASVWQQPLPLTRWAALRSADRLLSDALAAILGSSGPASGWWLVLSMLAASKLPVVLLPRIAQCLQNDALVLARHHLHFSCEGFGGMDQQADVVGGWGFACSHEGPRGMEPMQPRRTLSASWDPGAG